MATESAGRKGITNEKSIAALLLIDVINDLEFPGGEELLPHALEAAHAIAGLKDRCKRTGIPAIYINDNFGRWQSDFRKLVEHCVDDPVRGREIARLLRPDEDRDYFVLKPKHSGFFSTTLDTLLDHLGARKLIIAGFTADSCVLFTAGDAYMRDYELFVPADCVASEDPAENQRELLHMQRVLKANIQRGDELDLVELKREVFDSSEQARPEPQAPRFASE
jgi:nicotinamidase-related amidase